MGAYLPIPISAVRRSFPFRKARLRRPLRKGKPFGGWIFHNSWHTAKKPSALPVRTASIFGILPHVGSFIQIGGKSKSTESKPTASPIRGNLPIHRANSNRRESPNLRQIQIGGNLPNLRSNPNQPNPDRRRIRAAATLPFPARIPPRLSSRGTVGGSPPPCRLGCTRGSSSRRSRRAPSSGWIRRLP